MKKNKPKQLRGTAPITKIADFCRARDSQLFDQYLSMIGTDLGQIGAGFTGLDGDIFGAMAVQAIFHQERQILACERPVALKSIKKRLPAMRAEYARMISELKKKIGAKHYKALYESQRKLDDGCDMVNRGVVRPRFREDGTHE